MGCHVMVELPDDVDIKEVRDFVNANLESIANGIAADAKASDAFKDGTPPKLRRSIKVKKLKGGDGFVVRASARHANLVEGGHAVVRKGVLVGHTPPHAFLRTARDKALAKIFARFSR